MADKRGEHWWRENLRMHKSTFLFLCNELREHIQRQDTVMRQPITVEERVALTIWRLGTGAEYRTISELFGIGRATVCVIVNETCRSIVKYLLPRFVCFPVGDRLKEVVRGFEARWGFPQVAGCIDGTHIPIIRPQDSGTDYYNRKGYYSLLMQAVVDSRGIFTDIYIGWPGKVHDARVFINSNIYKKGTNGTLLPNWMRTINQVDVPLLLLGDPAYPLLPWLMKAYPETPTTPADIRNFNYRLSRARMTVENAFGRLKGRWRCLLKRNDSSITNVTNVIAACVVLHNVCELYGDECHSDWVYETPQGNARLSTATATSLTTTTAGVIRDSLKTYLNH